MAERSLYSPIPSTDRDASSHLLSKEDTSSDDESITDTKLHPGWRRWTWVHLLHIVSLTLSASMLAGSHVMYSRAQGIARQPAIATAKGLEKVTQEYHAQHFEGSIFMPSPFKGPPSPEVDARWKALVPDQTLQISREELIRAGGSEASVRFADKYGGGYMAYLELPHQIHCLHELWKYTWPTYYKSIEQGAEDPNSTFRYHLDHCADLLRQKLLCTADTTLVTYNWVEHLSHATPNFNTTHQCRNASAVYEWLDQNQSDLPDEAFDKPEDAVELKTWPKK